MREELADSGKPFDAKGYFTYILVDGTENVIGFISGRKNMKLLAIDNGYKVSTNDLLLRMFIGSRYTGKGYGTLIIAKFIELYRRLLGSSQSANLVSDIALNNVASIKIHEKNGFIFTKEVLYPNGKYYKRYVKKI
jgi:RimJ/RimL family protein N-acetyltransferase